MKGYLITIITASICVGIYNIIAPSFSGLEKYSKMIGMLVVLCIIISPIKEIINTFDEDGLESLKDSLIGSDYEDGDYNEIFNNYLNSFSLDELEKEIKNILLEKFEIPNDEVEMVIATENENGTLSLSNIQILLSGRSIFKNPYKIEEYFEELLNCSCQVLIK